MKRIPTLDGWRGIAILMVLITHLQMSLLRHAWHFAWMDLGQHGVTIFFVLSGYLITTRLQAEKEVDHLRSFYLRRFFRLMPCAWLYLLAVAFFGLLIHQRMVTRDFWGCLFFYRNYGAFEGVPVLTCHFWSLSIEEQFYLLWPLFLIVLGARKSLVFAIAASLGCAAWRLWHWSSYDSGYNFLRTEARVDALLVGCSLALLIQSAEVRAFFQRFARPVVALGLASLCLHIYKFQTLLPLSESVTIAALIGTTSVSAENSLMSRFLEYKHLRFLGLCSYSVYVWQQVFLMPRWGVLAPIVASFLPLIAVLSYALIERPCVELGRKLEKRLRNYQPYVNA
ncbi:acyltransferase family protein [Edaphobacter bradus]|uniref:acyltransferase family protein n=1 Tax=Edaphobacter bradus TaxID=2259016 RepID=UPI0021DF7DCE|nr:acyltransferase [Edaphobacter bradus]